MRSTSSLSCMPQMPQRGQPDAFLLSEWQLALQKGTITWLGTRGDIGSYTPCSNMCITLGFPLEDPMRRTTSTRRTFTINFGATFKRKLKPKLANLQVLWGDGGPYRALQLLNAGFQFQPLTPRNSDFQQILDENV